ncbi:MAG: hypothetical protein ABIH37_02925 [archaeon]
MIEFIAQIYYNIIYFIDLSLNTDVLWVIMPLIIATIIMLFYFEKYKDEQRGWNTHVGNSLVLLFISVMLLRYLYSIENQGVFNFIDYPIKFFIALGLLIIGIIVLFMNFEHFLPEKIAKYISSPLTLNLLAYAVILYVFAGTENIRIFLSPGTGTSYLEISLFVYFVVLIIILNLAKIPIRNLFSYVQKLKEQEEREILLNEKKDFQKKKKIIEKQEKLLKKAKKEISQKEKQEEKTKLKKFEKQKKQAIKLKKVVKKTLPIKNHKGKKR